MISLSTDEVRNLALHAQGLGKTRAFGTGEAGVLRCIEQLGYVQIDTISVIKRAHHHTLWTRVPDYQEAFLDNLQKARKIFEYWAHAAAYLPMRDYRFCLPRMQAIAAGEKHWHNPQHKLMDYVLDRIRAEGPLQASAFEKDTKRNSGGWWQCKPSKKALEQLFIQGQLVVSHRNGFQKIYDLPERVLPSDIDTSQPSPEEFQRFVIMRAIQTYGVATAAEMTYLRKGLKKSLGITLAGMVDAGEILTVTYPQASSSGFTTPAMLQQLPGRRTSAQVRLLCPFDNLVIQRKRLQQIFGFDYQLECYVPANKRKYGYYSLPVLFGRNMMGRLDPKVERKAGVLIVRNLALESGAQVDDRFAARLAERLYALARFNDCETESIENCHDRSFKTLLQQKLACL